MNTFIGGPFSVDQLRNLLNKLISEGDGAKTVYNESQEPLVAIKNDPNYCILMFSDRANMPSDLTD